jgi:hypothetical protein
MDKHQYPPGVHFFAPNAFLFSVLVSSFSRLFSLHFPGVHAVGLISTGKVWYLFSLSDFEAEKGLAKSSDPNEQQKFGQICDNKTFSFLSFNSGQTFRRPIHTSKLCLSFTFLLA